MRERLKSYPWVSEILDLDLSPVLDSINPSGAHEITIGFSGVYVAYVDVLKKKCK